MLDLNTATHYWMFPEPADMRKGKDKLAALIRERHTITRSQLLLFLTGAVQTRLSIE